METGNSAGPTAPCMTARDVNWAADWAAGGVESTHAREDPREPDAELCDLTIS